MRRFIIFLFFFWLGAILFDWTTGWSRRRALDELGLTRSDKEYTLREITTAQHLSRLTSPDWLLGHRSLESSLTMDNSRLFNFSAQDKSKLAAAYYYLVPPEFFCDEFDFRNLELDAMEDLLNESVWLDVITINILHTKKKTLKWRLCRWLSPRILRLVVQKARRDHLRRIDGGEKTHPDAPTCRGYRYMEALFVKYLVVVLYIMEIMD
mmetsp:Transcript_1260/g.2262  ORF Transcript_1260/g.2262 Transcript_1260/m.2262 type:complete len:209 (+) Transcript_1260:22-648(+)